MNSDLVKIISGIITMAFIIFGITFIVNSCDNKWSREQMKYDQTPDSYIIKEIDSCEYFMVRTGTYIGGANFLPIHKHNCKFCKERELNK